MVQPRRGRRQRGGAGIAAREIAEDMTAREIAIAQRAARDWLSLTARRAA